MYGLLEDGRIAAIVLTKRASGYGCSRSTSKTGKSTPVEGLQRTPAVTYGRSRSVAQSCRGRGMTEDLPKQAVFRCELAKITGSAAAVDSRICELESWTRDRTRVLCFVKRPTTRRVFVYDTGRRNCA